MVTDDENGTYAAGGLLISPGPFQPLVNFVARINAGVFVKLLSGFLVGALLLLGMGILSLVVIARMSQRVNELNLLQEEVDRARQMIYAVTAQSHFRAMALVCEFVPTPPSVSSDDCTPDPPWNDRIARSKIAFLNDLDQVDKMSPAVKDTFISDVREANNRLAGSSDDVLALYQAGDIEDALDLHIAEEHEVSHQLEQAMTRLIEEAQQDTSDATAAFESDRGFLRAMVATFSGVSLAVAILLGFVLSWLVTGPVRRMGQAMGRIAAGDFSQPVRVENKDELGALASRINQTAEELARLQAATLAEERARALQERIAQVTLAQEEERRRISRELHDGLGPSLAAIGNRVRACRSIVRSDSELAERELEEIADGLTGSIREIRALINDLRPLSLDQLGLMEALRQHVETFGHETGIPVSFGSSLETALNPLVEVTVFRIVQECLSNVGKHADASHVAVSLQPAGSGLELSVIDDGRGFDPAAAAPDTGPVGMGLTSMRERAELLNGSLSVKSAPGEGCRIVLYIPLEEQVGTDSNSSGG